MEKQLAANVITFQEYINKRRQIIEDYYRDSRISAEEYYDALESMYSKSMMNMLPAQTTQGKVLTL